MQKHRLFYAPFLFDALKTIGREASLWLSGVIVFVLMIAVEVANNALSNAAFANTPATRFSLLGGFFLLYIALHSFAFALITHSIHTANASLRSNLSAAFKRLLPLMAFYITIFLTSFISTIPSVFSVMMMMQGHHSPSVMIPFAVSGAFIALSLFLLTRYILFPYILLLEKHSIRESLRLSASRLHGRKWQVFFTGLGIPLVMFGIIMYPLKMIPIAGMALATTLWLLFSINTLYLFYRNTRSESSES